MSETTVVAGSSTSKLAEKLATKLGAGLITSDIRVFPDGESKITLSGTPSGRCIVVQSTHPPVDTNLVRALALAHKVGERASSMIVVIPYMGYARQDREFLDGEVVTLRVVAELLRGIGVGRMVTVDMHSRAGLACLGQGAKNVSAIPELAKYFGGMDLGNSLVVSPDRGGRSRAAEFAKMLGLEYIALEKERDRRTGAVSIRNDKVDAAGRNVILVDDMISTGGSMIKAAEFLKMQGCGSVFASCTHALLIDDTIERMRRAGIDQVVSANTIPGDTAKVDVSGIIADAVS